MTPKNYYRIKRGRQYLKPQGLPYITEIFHRLQEWEKCLRENTLDAWTIWRLNAHEAPVGRNEQRALAQWCELTLSTKVPQPNKSHRAS
jgi:hypothetical protein